MNNSNDALYGPMADSYHLIFEDWQETIDRQSAIISRLLLSPSEAGPILDCAELSRRKKLPITRQVGFDQIEVPAPSLSGYYQPIVSAVRA